VFQFIQRIDKLIASAERVLLISIAAALVVIMMAQVILRYFFNSPIYWAEEIAVQLLVFMTLFGLSLLVQQVQLVTIDFLPRALPDRARHALFALLGSVMILILAFIAWQGWHWIVRPDVQMEISATTQLPRWYNFTVLPVALSIMVWHQAVAVLRDLQAIQRGSK